MFISHENKCVNMDNMDSIEVAYREMHKDYIIQIKNRGLVELCIYSSGHMTFEEAKFVYRLLVAAMDGYYFDTRKKRWVEKPEEKENTLMVDEENVDWVVRLYHEEFEKKEDNPDDSQ